MGSSMLIVILVFLINISVNYLYLKKNKINSEIKHYTLFFMIIPLAIYLFIAILINQTTLIFISNLELLYSIILYIFFALALIMTVPAINITPPTLRIILMFKNRKKVHKKEILKLFSRTELFDSRLKLLVTDNLTKIKGDKIYLTKYGNLIALIFIIYKKIIGEAIGSG